MTLRTRYSELMTLTSQYIKFITDTQRRLEEEEVRDNPRGIVEHSPNNNTNNNLNNLIQPKPNQTQTLTHTHTHTHSHRINVWVTRHALSLLLFLDRKAMSFLVLCMGCKNYSLWKGFWMNKLEFIKLTFTTKYFADLILFLSKAQWRHRVHQGSWM